VGEEVLYVIATLRRCPALEEAMGGMRQAGPVPAPDVARLETRRAKRASEEILQTRGASRLVDAPAPATRDLRPAPPPTDIRRPPGRGKVAFELRLRHEP